MVQSNRNLNIGVNWFLRNFGSSKPRWPKQAYGRVTFKAACVPNTGFYNLGVDYEHKPFVQYF